jgi:hypothetical protein
MDDTTFLPGHAENSVQVTALYSRVEIKPGERAIAEITYAFWRLSEV